MVTGSEKTDSSVGEIETGLEEKKITTLEHYME